MKSAGESDQRRRNKISLLIKILDFTNPDASSNSWYSWQKTDLLKIKLNNLFIYLKWQRGSSGGGLTCEDHNRT